jgi:diketogulonate reductase-like aldo/keto reductase
MLEKKIIFGTYKLNDKTKIKEIMEYIHLKGINTIDTAQLYRNECMINDIINETEHETEDETEVKQMNFYINTKISKYPNLGYVNKRLLYVKELFGKKLKGLMLHHPAEICFNKHLQEQCSSMSIDYGMSNITLKQLQFYHSCGIFPKFIQIEFHPFVPIIDIVNYCNLHNIKIQGYAILANCKYLSFIPLINMSIKYNVSVAQLMIRWAYQHNIELCLTSLNTSHIDEWIAANNFIINEVDMAEINGYYVKYPHRFYNKIPNQLVNLNLPGDIPEYFDSVVDMLKADLIKLDNGEYISDIVIHLSKITLHSLNEDPFYNYITNSVIDSDQDRDQDQTSRNVKFANLLKKLRKVHNDQHKTKISTIAKTKKSCLLSNNHHILHPEAMPVDITDEIMFKPFFDYIESDDIPTEPKTFIKGTFYPDMRMDLCKQVVGYKSIKALCEVVQKSNKVKHFLLGNNIAFDQNEKVGADALASLIKNSSIETWYLAGNTLRSVGLKIICEALYNNQYAKALWLKRNPIHTGTLHLKKMLNNNSTLELLDLNNCGLGNNGLLQLFEDNNNVTLKHIYLDTNNINNLGHFTRYIQHCHQLESIYLSMNPIDPNSLKEFIQGLSSCSKLERLCLSSCGLGDEFEFDLINIPTLRMLDLGMYKATNDLGLESNKFTNASTDNILQFITRHPKLEYISFYGSPISDIRLFDYQLINPNLSISLTSETSYVKDIDYLSREVRHPRMVQNIDSIYRGK